MASLPVSGPRPGWPRLSEQQLARLAHLGAQSRLRQFVAIGADPQCAGSAAGVHDGRLYRRRRYRSVECELFLLNAFDERADLYRYAQCTVQTCSANPYIATNRPRTIGIRVGAKF